MAITRYSTFDKTVNTIAERNAIVNKVNHMTVVVKDAIADPSAGAGKAIYRWDAVDNEWILVSKSSYETISFITEEIMIVNGEVQLSNFPVNNSVWGAVVLSGQLIYAELNTSAVTIANSKITGINSDFNGKTLRVTYAYGSIAVQITSAIEDSVDAALLNNVKTINGVEILGTGNIVVEGVLPELKTVNSQNIVGSGNIEVNFSDVVNKPTTISGYGITDAYTKTEVESKIVELSPPTDISMKADITYVDSKIADIINLAPETLDTFGEIAAKLTEDEGAVATLTSIVGTKANSSDVYTKTQIDSSLNNKVDKVNGKQLSTEDYTTAEKTKLAGLNNYSLPIASATVLGGVKAGTNISIDANGVISANDTSIAWSEITSKPTTLSGYGITDSIQSTLVSGTNIKTINGTSVLGSGDISTIQTTITGNAGTATTLETARNIALTGDVTGNVNFDGSANVSITTTIAANSVTLGTDTTGNYVAGVTQGTGITVSGTAGEGWSPTIAITNVGTAGTYTKVTTNAQGQVTSGTSLSASDIPSLDASKITTGIIDAARLPAFVDDVLEFADQASFPATGESGKIYVALDTNKTYRWSGSVYVYITSGAVDSVNGQTGVVNITTITGNAGTATTLQTARTIGTSGDVTGTETSFNGSANITIPMTLANSGVTAGTYSKVTVDAKGRVTAGSNPTTLSSYGITDAQTTLVSGTNIKTINGTSVLGSGDISISGGATLSDDTTTNSTYYPTFAITTTGNMSTAKVSSTKLTFNPSTGTLAATEINSLSDVNKKENITNITNGLEIINKLNGVEFDWKENGNHSSGVIAQELEKVLPFLVTEIEGTKTVNYLGIIGYLINAVQELSKK